MNFRNDRLWGFLWVLPFKMLRNCGSFDATMTAPGGENSAFFVQLINYDNFIDLKTTGGTGTCYGPASAPALDQQFPYNKKTSPLSAVDAPVTPLGDPTEPTVPVEMEGNRAFSATMYLMWYPTNVPANPNFELAMPVPLGSIGGTFGGDAINTLHVQDTMNSGSSKLNDTTFILNSCSGCTSPSMRYVSSSPNQQNYGYPTWTALSTLCSGAGSTEASGGNADAKRGQTLN
jgi:hypothetical protein